jgi:heterodisulfide reductase subunit D
MGSFTRNEYNPLLQVSKDAYRCGKCMLCKYIDHEEMRDTRFLNICPSGTRFQYEAYFASGKQEIARGLLQGDIEYTDKMMHALFTCTLCGGCQAVCSVAGDKNPLKTIVALREKAVLDGMAPLPEHEAIFKSIENYDNPWQQPRARRDNWARRLGIKDASKEKVDTLLFVGCTYAYNSAAQEVVQDLARLMAAAGVDFGILGKEEPCCASPILRIGDYETFKRKAAVNLKLLNATGASRIIAPCSGCYSVLKEEYPDIGEENFEVLSAVELLEEMVDEGSLKPRKKINRTVTYHDPCHLGRYCEVFDAPRNLLSAIPGLQLVEMSRSRENSWCCGSGGGVKTAFPDLALWSAGMRMEEAESVGAELMASACPWCESNLRDGNRTKLEVTSVIRLLAESVG